MAKSLNELIQKLHEVFHEDRVNVEEVQELMESYKSNPQDWKTFAIFDAHK